IESRPFFLPIHNLPAFREMSNQRKAELPVTDRLCGVGMNLPTYNNMTTDETWRVVKTIKNLI
ncbi:MAG: DegT/DnrJ/EryC1/StrS family aminotransferase, partial [bacterium]|nr:DegT/DnrJ/EryC1/StrS family aminotransferase [bacterium]